MTTKKVKKLSVSARLRTACSTLQKGRDLRTVSYLDIVRVARKNMRDATAREAFSPAPAHVSIIKREFTGGHEGRGRPSHASIGVIQEAA